MNKAIRFATFMAAGLWIFTACNENEAPTITELSVSKDTIYVGEQSVFEAKVSSDISFSHTWKVNNEVKSQETAFTFQPTASGQYKVKLVVDSNYGKDSSEVILTVLRAYEVIDFETPALTSANSFWNGTTQSSSFTSGKLNLPNNIDTQYFSWSGFAYSNMNDTVTTDYANQYSVFDSKNNGNQFALLYSSEAKATFINDQQFEVQSIEICNTTIAGIVIKEGNTFSKKFGGVNGNDPDYFKVIITGYNALDIETGKVEAYLADFRAADNTKDYIVSEWTEVNLRSLGSISKFSISFESTDNGTWGMNTPAYVCIDNLKYLLSE
jgi:hypothetical protein